MAWLYRVWVLDYSREAPDESCLSDRNLTIIRAPTFPLFISLGQHFNALNLPMLLLMAPLFWSFTLP
jgi:hypothetical protein